MVLYNNIWFFAKVMEVSLYMGNKNTLKETQSCNM